jgi:drug/metabolite transporter (DMT)-like permease
MISALSSPTSIGAAALLVALLSLPVYYLIYRHAPEPKKRRSLLRYLLVSLVVGAIAFVIGTMLGIFTACFPASAGNLCGLVGVFGIGPLTSALAMVVYAHHWARDARRIPQAFSTSIWPRIDSGKGSSVCTLTLNR